MNIQVNVTTDGSWGYLGGHDTVPPCCPARAPACSCAASTLTENQKMLWCYSRISRETWLTMKCRVGAMLAAYVYFISFWKAAELEAPCEGREGRRWNVPGAAGTCLRHRNARKTQHAALAAVCIHSPSRCRQLLMLLSKFNVTFFSLLLFLSGLLFSLLYFFFLFSCYFPTATCLYHNCQASWNGHSYRQKHIVKTTPYLYFFLFPHHGKTFFYEGVLFSCPLPLGILLNWFLLSFYRWDIPGTIELILVLSNLI